MTAIKRFVREQGIDLIRFQREERKDDRAQDYLRRSSGGEGVLFVGVAQEKAHVARTCRVLLLLAVQRQAVPQRRRVSEAATGP